MKKLVFLLLCFTSAQLLHAQDNNFNRSPITLQSPDATQFIRYGNIPVDYSTGIPNISVPLYTVTCGNINLPIDISYNAGGIKVLDIAGTVGLGWNLNYGGVVSKTVLGTDDAKRAFKPDLYAKYNQAHANTTYNNVCDFTNTVAQVFIPNAQQIETQSDRYFYSFNGRSGIFRVDFQTGVVKTIPYSPLKITIATSGTYKITDESGTNFYFEQPELTGSSNSGSPSYTSYYLTRIESSDLTHTIKIHYKQDAEVDQFIKNYQLEHSVAKTSLAGYGPYISTQIHDNEFISISIPVMPDTITSDNETVLFQYIADRPDLRKSRLSNIKILNRVTGETIKIFEFQQSYFGTASGNNQRLRLNNLNVKSNDNILIQQYGFDYNSTPLPPYYRAVGMGEHHNVDYWGYYNGADDPNLLPKELFDPLPNLGIYGDNSRFTYDDQRMYGGNRNPNPETVQACMLTSITYPTGGTTKFEYELNQVANGYSYINNNAQNYGGLRVKKITSTADAVSAPIIKSYSYTGWFHTMIQNELYQYNTASTTFRSSSDPIGVTNNSSSIINTDPLMPMSTGSGPLVIYDNVIEYDGTETNNNGYTQYTYDNSNIPYQLYDPGTYGNPSFWGFYLIDYGNYKPQLSAKVVYGKDQNNNIKEVKGEYYTYKKFNSGSFTTGIKVQRNNPYQILSSGTDCDVSTGGNNSSAEAQQALAYLLNLYQLSNTTGVLDVPLLTQKTERIHPSTGTGDLITTTNFTYDLVTLQPIQEDVKNSKGETLISVKKYPTDFSSVAPYNAMVLKNILTPVVEQLAYKNAVSSQNFLQSTKTNYDFWSGNSWSSSTTNIIVPRTVDTKAKDQSTYETRLRYYSYDDKANLTTFSKENDVKKTYLWGYNKTYPVAEIVGADYMTASSYVNQSILDNPTDDASLRTHLNNLRNVSNWFIKTFTYKPLVGMTSQTDPQGRSTYYEYDSFGRLAIMRDKDNNVLKKICYNYAGQSTACTLFGNQAQSGTFTRNNCTGGAISSQVTYTVPANKYTATTQTDANALATNDISANGQAYANANGTCTVPTVVTVSGQNITTVYGYVQFTNTATGAYNSLYLYPNSNTSISLPGGTYNITFSEVSSPQIYTIFRVNGYSTYGTSATFSYINITPGSVVRIGN